MMAWWAGLATIGLMGAAVPSPPLRPPPPITDVRPIVVHGGVTSVPGFLPDGGTARIVQAWRGNGNAHGYFVWMVLAGPDMGEAVRLVEFEGATSDSSSGDTIGASPFDGERVTADVRFATARIAGQRVSLAIKGVLDEAPSGVIADHATATIRWYKLVHRVEEVGAPPDAFVEIGALRTTKRYCTVDLALRDVADLPLPRGFAGANRVDGCFAGG